MTHPEFDFNKKPDLNEKEARRLRDEGIDRAVTKADKESPRWSDRAYKLFVEKFLLNHNGPFMGEDFRSYCALMDFDSPHSNRAFGGIFLRARHAGIIRSLGKKETRSKKSHRANAEVWIQVKPSERK